MHRVEHAPHQRNDPEDIFFKKPVFNARDPYILKDAVQHNIQQGAHRNTQWKNASVTLDRLNILRTIHPPLSVNRVLEDVFNTQSLPSSTKPLILWLPEKDWSEKERLYIHSLFDEVLYAYPFEKNWKFERRLTETVFKSDCCQDMKKNVSCLIEAHLRERVRTVPSDDFNRSQERTREFLRILYPGMYLQSSFVLESISPGFLKGAIAGERDGENISVFVEWLQKLFLHNRIELSRILHTMTMGGSHENEKIQGVLLTTLSVFYDKHRDTPADGLTAKDIQRLLMAEGKPRQESAHDDAKTR